MNIPNGISVAIVDDNATMRTCIHELVTIWGYHVSFQAINGVDLFKQLTPANVPDICILDLNMPQMNGYEAMRRLRQDWPDVKILIFSMDLPAGGNAAVLMGADAKVSKTASISELKKALAQLRSRKTMAC